MNDNKKRIVPKVSDFHKRAFLLTIILTIISLLSIVVFMFVTPPFVSGISAVDELTWGKQFRYYVNIQDWEGLYRQSMQVIEKVDDLPGAHYMAGIASEHLKDLDRAIEHYKNAVKYDPGNIPYYYSCANALFSAGRQDEAEKYFLSGYNEASGELLFRFNYQLGRLYYEKGNYEETEKYLTRAIDFNPNEMPIYLMLGEIFLVQERYADAINLLNEGIGKQPGNMKIMQFLVEANLKDNRFNAAMAAWKKYQGDEIQKLYFLIRWGHGYFRTDDPETAKKFFDLILMMDDDNAAAKSGLRAYENYTSKNE